MLMDSVNIITPSYQRKSKRTKFTWRHWSKHDDYYEFTLWCMLSGSCWLHKELKGIELNWWRLSVLHIGWEDTWLSGHAGLLCAAKISVMTQSQNVSKVLRPSLRLAYEKAFFLFQRILVRFRMPFSLRNNWKIVIIPSWTLLEPILKSRSHS